MYRAYLEQSQIFVGIYWQRYGWVGPGMEISGLEDEYRASRWHADAPIREASGPKPGAGADEDARRYPRDRQDVVPGVHHGEGAGMAAGRRPCSFAERKLCRRHNQHLGAASVVGGTGRAGRTKLPSGTVTFLLTDIEGSTRLWESEPEAMEVALRRHDRLLAGVIEEYGGRVITSRGEGDGFFAFFPSAVAAVEAAGVCQLRLGARNGPRHCAARADGAAHRGSTSAWTRLYRPLAYQPLCPSEGRRVRRPGALNATRDLVAGRLGGGFGLKQLGEFRLRFGRATVDLSADPC